MFCSSSSKQNFKCCDKPLSLWNILEHLSHWKSNWIGGIISSRCCSNVIEESITPQIGHSSKEFNEFIELMIEVDDDGGGVIICEVIGGMDNWDDDDDEVECFARVCWKSASELEKFRWGIQRLQIKSKLFVWSWSWSWERESFISLELELLFESLIDDWSEEKDFKICVI